MTVPLNTAMCVPRTTTCVGRCSKATHEQFSSNAYVKERPLFRLEDDTSVVASTGTKATVLVKTKERSSSKTSVRSFCCANKEDTKTNLHSLHRSQVGGLLLFVLRLGYDTSCCVAAAAAAETPTVFVVAEVNRYHAGFATVVASSFAMT